MVESAVDGAAFEVAHRKIEAILDEMQGLGSLVIAFSGGVDSSVVAALAHRALGDEAVAITAVSETLAERELRETKRIADEIGIVHELIEFSELDDERFRENPPSRCYFCQSMRFEEIGAMAETLGAELVASGTNADDEGDHRPGLEAMRRKRVYQPLLEHGVTKKQVRAIARILGLSVWDKPAMACLSSRIPHGMEVTQKRLRRIERAEEELHGRGIDQFRVRAHGSMARIEIAPRQMDSVADAEVLGELAKAIAEAGFERVVWDLQGYRAGSLNPE